MAQRNLTPSQVRYVVRHGKRTFAAKAAFHCLRRSDVPRTDRVGNVACKLTGVVVIVEDGLVITVYRNEKPLRHVGKKPKWFTPRRGVPAA